MKYELWHDVTWELDVEQDPDESGAWLDRDFACMKSTLKENGLRLRGPELTHIKGRDYDVYEITGFEESMIRAKDEINSHCSFWHINSVCEEAKNEELSKGEKAK